MIFNGIFENLVSDKNIMDLIVEKICKIGKHVCVILKSIVFFKNKRLITSLKIYIFFINIFIKIYNCLIISNKNKELLINRKFDKIYFQYPFVTVFENSTFDWLRIFLLKIWLYNKNYPNASWLLPVIYYTTYYIL